MKGGLTKRSRLLISVVFLLAFVLALSTLSYILPELSIQATPRLLKVGDNWAYTVIYPDGETFSLTESVMGLTELNGTKTYLFLRDDTQHISTEYLWVTTDWRELQTFQPHIGNLGANSTVTYTPPIQLLRIPLKTGDKWRVSTSVTTTTELQKSRIRTVVQLVEEREVRRIEEVSTLAGTFRTFRVDASMNRSLSEIIWFDTSLGQVVKAEYYNLKQEAVTQTLVTYSELSRYALSLGLMFSWARSLLETPKELYLYQRPSLILS